MVLLCRRELKRALRVFPSDHHPASATWKYHIVRDVFMVVASKFSSFGLLEATTASTRMNFQGAISCVCYSVCCICSFPSTRWPSKPRALTEFHRFGRPCTSHRAKPNEREYLFFEEGEQLINYYSYTVLLSLAKVTLTIIIRYFGKNCVHVVRALIVL